MAGEVTVVCVLVAGPVRGFSTDYVVRLERMVRRNIERPYRFVCLTDGTRGDLPKPIETMRVKNFGSKVPQNGQGYWTKVQLFNRGLGFAGRMLFLDLDVLIVGSLDEIIDYAPFALCEDRHPEKADTPDRHGRKIIRKFNSSVMVWNAGEQSEIWDRWTPDVAQRLSTDQDWIGELSTTAQPLPKAWCPRMKFVHPPPFPCDAKVILVKKPKPHDAVNKWTWFEPLWGAK